MAAKKKQSAQEALTAYTGQLVMGWLERFGKPASPAGATQAPAPGWLSDADRASISEYARCVAQTYLFKDVKIPGGKPACVPPKTAQPLPGDVVSKWQAKVPAETWTFQDYFPLVAAGIAVLLYLDWRKKG